MNDGLNNIWIVKASSSSRGRNIFLIDSIKDVKNTSSMRIIQKYIENVWIYHSSGLESTNLHKKHPFLNKIQEKKFDIRLWVAVKSFSPLEAYIYEEGYLRITQ
jgi:hypothetical protein